MSTAADQPTVATPRDAQLRAERRAGPRVAFTARVRLRRSEGPPVHGASLDLGLGGACLQLAEPVDVRSVRRVEVALGRATLDVEAKGTWQRPSLSGFTLGVQFQNVGAADKSLLWRALQGRALELSRFIVESSELDPIDVDVAMDLTLRTRRREFAAGTRIYRAGSFDEADVSILIVVSGAVSLHIPAGGGHMLEVDRIQVGGVFGGVPLLIGVPNVETATAVSLVQALEVDRYSMLDLCAEKPLAGRALERAVLRRYPRIVTELAARVSPGEPAPPAA